MATLAFGARVRSGDVPCEGIGGITADDIAFAGRNGFVVKLLAIAERFHDDGATSIVARVHPALVPVTHPLASVRESYNAVFVESAVVGELMFYGRGAGGDPTASAVLGDLIDAAANVRRGGRASLGSFVDVPLRSVDDLVSAFYVSLQAVDRPGVLATVAGVFGDTGVSIRSMEQEGPSDPTVAPPGTDVRIVFITHVARERDLRATISDLRELDAVARVGSVVRVLGDDG